MAVRIQNLEASLGRLDLGLSLGPIDWNEITSGAFCSVGHSMPNGVANALAPSSVSVPPYRTEYQNVPGHIPEGLSSHLTLIDLPGRRETA